MKNGTTPAPAYASFVSLTVCGSQRLLVNNWCYFDRSPTFTGCQEDTQALGLRTQGSVGERGWRGPPHGLQLRGWIPGPEGEPFPRVWELF